MRSLIAGIAGAATLCVAPVAASEPIPNWTVEKRLSLPEEHRNFPNLYGAKIVGTTDTSNARLEFHCNPRGMSAAVFFAPFLYTGGFPPHLGVSSLGLSTDDGSDLSVQSAHFVDRNVHFISGKDLWHFVNATSEPTTISSQYGHSITVDPAGLAEKSAALSYCVPQPD